jgi:hypothetical protein
MNALPPGWLFVVEETTANHCVATCGDVVLVLAYAGSHADVQHVTTGARVLEHLARRRMGKARLLCVLPAGHAKAPVPAVRSAVLDAARRVGDRVSKGALVVPGSGFAAAIQRGALTGMMTVARLRTQIKVTGDLREGLGYLLAADEGVIAPLLRFCEERREGGPAQEGRTAPGKATG